VVSPDDIEVVRAAYEAYARGDLAAAAAAYAPDNEWDVHRLRPDADTTRGVDELAEGIGTWRDAWRDHFFELESLTPAGDAIVAVINEGGVGRTSGAPVRFRYGQIIVVRNGKIAKTVVYRDPEEAFRDAGIAPT
jgi:ketosteroid isomerase-like protein